MLPPEAILLETVGARRALSREQYQKAFPALQERLRGLQYALKDADVATTVVFEGWGASGRGEVIRRLTEKLDPRAFRAHAGTPASELENRYHWLWRFQVRLPEDGQIALFDGSWYGRVLEDRVEKRVRGRVWRQGYDQINEFERWLADDGQVLCKFFFHISEKEQRARLKAMEKDPRERWRVAKADRRQNRHYDDWARAFDDALAKTETAYAPWTIVEATDPRHTRVRVFEVLAERWEAALARRKEFPSAVSRSRSAAEATREERARRAAADFEREARTAADAGMPLSEA